MKYVIICIALACLAVTLRVSGQAHAVVFEKLAQTYPQWYYEGTTFPEAQIKQKWREGFEIVTANIKEKRWFIAMRKNAIQARQQYYFNISNQVLNEKRADGYSIVDLCYYYNPWDLKPYTFCVLNKVSPNPVYDTYIMTEVVDGSRSYQDYSSYLVGMLHTSTTENYRIQTVRTYQYPKSRTMLATVVARAQSDPQGWVWATRTEYPSDFIRTKIKDGFKIKTCIYSYFDKVWLVVMEYAAGASWQVVNYTNRTRMKAAIDDGYTIVGVY